MAKKQPKPIPMPGIDPKAGTIKFDYIKSNSFRVIHVDGFHGGPSPRPGVQVCAFSERWPIPQQTIHSMDASGMVSGEIKEQRVSRDAIVREVEFEMMMSVDVARSLRDFLSQKLASIDQKTADKKNGK